MYPQKFEAKIHCDSQSALSLTKNPTFYDRTKHIDIHSHFVRVVVKERNVKLVKINIEHNPTNILTKLYTA